MTNPAEIASNDAVPEEAFRHHRLLERLAQAALRFALVDRRRANRFWARTAAGTRTWQDVVAEMRRALAAGGWTIRDTNGRPSAISPEGDLEVFFFTGSPGTGVKSGVPARSRTPRTKAAAQGSGRLFVLQPGEGWLVPQEPVRRFVGVLFHVAADEVRIELVRFAALDAQKDIAGLAHPRTILASVPRAAARPAAKTKRAAKTTTPPPVERKRQKP